MCKSTITCKDLFSGIHFFSMQSSDLNCTMTYVIFQTRFLTIVWEKIISLSFLNVSRKSFSKMKYLYFVAKKTYHRRLKVRHLTNVQTCNSSTARFLKYVWSFYNIMRERVKTSHLPKTQTHFNILKKTSTYVHLHNDLVSETVHTLCVISQYFANTTFFSESS